MIDRIVTVHGARGRVTDVVRYQGVVRVRVDFGLTRLWLDAAEVSP